MLRIKRELQIEVLKIDSEKNDVPINGYSVSPSIWVISLDGINYKIVEYTANMRYYGELRDFIVKEA